jgi:hypothetical protein
MQTLVHEETIVNNDGLSRSVQPLQEEIKNPPLYRGGLSRAVWLEEGIPLLLSAMTSNWDIGDWALRTPPEASRDEVRELLEEAATRTGYQVNSIRDLRTVAGRIPPPLRNRGLSWYGYKEISKLAVRENGENNEEKSLALRSEFIDKFVAQPGVGILGIRSAVRTRMGKGTARSDETQTVSFKLTTAEYTCLSAIVEAHPTHDSVPDFLQELVRNFLASEAEVSQ